jgi:hypothetical protein
MKKLKLNLEDLKVESFETSINQKKRIGTIKGFAPPFTETNCIQCEPTEQVECPTLSCGGTCPNTCLNTCAATCPDTCPVSCIFTACGDTCNDKIETCHPECI